MIHIESSAKSNIPGDGIKRDPDMDKSAVWASTDCMAVSPFPGYVSCRRPVLQLILLFHVHTESSPGKTMKQKSSCLGPMRISLASGSVHLVPHTGRTSVSGSISSAVATGEHLDQ